MTPSMRGALLYLTILVVSTCGIVFELLAGATATYLMGDSVTQFATIIGTYLTAMGGGAYLTRHVEERVAQRFVECQLAVALVGGASVPLIWLAFVRTSLLRPVLYSLVALTGVLVGAELPLLMRVIRRHVGLRQLVARALTVDYAGALLGSLLFALLLLPRLGMMRTGLFFGSLGGVAAFASTWPLHSVLAEPRRLRIRSAVVVVLLLAGAIGSRQLTAAADDATFTDPVIFAQQTAYQRIVVTSGHGGIDLFLDGNLQFAELDEYRYHEALVHPAFALAPRHDRVLVLGGGDGLAVREILEHPDVQSVTLVDLDHGMTDLARTLPPLRALNRGSLDDAKVHVVNDDAMVWLAREDAGPFDVAVLDFPDPNNFSLGKLYTTRFYRLLRQRLADDAVVVVQSTSPLAARQAFWCIAGTLETAGYFVRPYHATVPTFGEWGWVLASPKAFGPARALPENLRSLSDETLPELFVFPPDMARVPAAINRLNDQQLVRYYDEEWQRWVH